MKLSPELRAVVSALADVAGLPADDHPAPARVDWTRWLSIVDEHSLGPVLGAQVLRRPEWKLPAVTQSELAHRFNRSSFTAMVRQTEFQRVMRKLRTERVEAMVLKGSALAPGLYSVAAERVMWDIDLLFSNASSLLKARHVLESHGYQQRRELHGHHHVAPLVNPVNELAFELHSNLITPPLPTAVVDDILQRGVTRRLATDLDILIPDPIGLLAHQCLHALNDPVRSPLLRNIFEIAWLLSRMNDQQQNEFVDCVRRWNIEPIVARATHLAADLFGTPPLLSQPKAGAYSHWCRARLEWCDYGKWWARLKRHLASTHVERLLAGSHDRNIFTLVEIVSRTARDAAWSRLQPRIASRSAHPRRPDWPHAAAGRGLLIHDTDSGEVHLLNDVAARVWLAADGHKTGRAIIKEAGIGSVTNESRSALHALIGRGLISAGTITVPAAERSI